MSRGSRRAALRAAALEALKSGDDPSPPVPTGERREGDWVVRELTGAGSTKSYRCPGCDHEVRAGTPHVVAWPDGREDDRRHWHRPCWGARDRRKRLS